MSRLKPTERKRQLLLIAIQVAQKQGLVNVDARSVGAAANVSPGLVYHYHGPKERIQRSVIRYAIQTKMSIILQEALAIRHDEALKNVEKIRAVIKEGGTPRE